MIVANISLTLNGSVTLVRQRKNLSNKEVQLRVEDARKNPPSSITKNVFLDCPSYTNDVTLETSTCIKSIPVYQDTYDAILEGSVMPSYSTRRDNGLNIKTPKGFTLDRKKWLALSEYQRLWLYYIDHAIDAGATSHVVSFC